MRTGRSERGLTLLEIAITVVIFAAILAVVYPAFHTANQSISTGNVKDRMERHGDRLLAVVLEFLREGRVVSVAAAPAAPEIRVVHVRSDVDLAEISAGGAVPWSSTERVLRFRAKRELVEADLDEDLNRDGDRLDTFAVGVLEIDDGTGFRAITETGEVILGLPSHEGDLDGDGAADPLFVVDDRSVEIRIRLFGRDAAGRALATELRGTLRLRNDQD